jgi:hypothetical protein
VAVITWTGKAMIDDVHSKSISTGGSKTPLKTRPAQILGLGPKTGPYRRPQNLIGAWASPVNEPAQDDMILSGAPAARGGANPTPGAPLAATPPLSRWFLPPESSRRCFPPRSRLPAGQQL